MPPDFNATSDPGVQPLAYQQPHIQQQQINHEPAAAWIQQPAIPANGAGTIGVPAHQNGEEKDLTQTAKEWTESAGRTLGSWTSTAGSFLGTKVAEAQEAMGLNHNASQTSQAESMEKGGLPLPGGSSHSDSEKTAWQQVQESASGIGSVIISSANFVGEKVSEQTSKLMQHDKT